MVFFPRQDPRERRRLCPSGWRRGAFVADDPINAVRSYSGASPSGEIHGQAIGAQTSSLMVAVRCRPLLAEEHLRGVRKDIIRVMDDRMIVVLDPDDEKNYLDQQQHRSKERRYTFDRAFGKIATNRDVYNATAKSLIEGVLSGHNGTVSPRRHRFGKDVHHGRHPATPA